MILKQQYQFDISKSTIKADPKQEALLLHFERVYEDLLAREPHSKNIFAKINRYLGNGGGDPVKGIYLWGGVGIGKTYLMDLLYEALPSSYKMRMHFHVFMRRVHKNLKELQGKADPLKIIAKRFAKKTQVLCFDEFFVHDIADAMLLSGLLEAMFAEGICLVTTSNIEPDKLYENGLQRQRFLPVIDLIKQHTEVLHLDSDVDYRLKTLVAGGVYFTPSDEHADRAMTHCFQQLTHHHLTQKGPLFIEGREIAHLGLAPEAVWFDFDVICNIPRSQHDYLEIAQSFSTVLVSNIPQIGEHQIDKITYFINLIDVFYDHKVKLILSAEAPIDKLYLKGRKLTEFARTKSRLHEMQSPTYLHQAHT